MTIVEQLKSKSLELRKARNSLAPAISFVLSEIEKVGKNNGNRTTTEDEAIEVVRGLVAKLDENLKYGIDDERKSAFTQERDILVSVLPKMANDDEIVDTIRVYLTENLAAKKGDIMKAVREKFGANVDMQRVGTILAEGYNL